MSSKKFLTAEWRKLVMANYEIDPGVLKKYIPAHTELDTFNDKHYVSLVGFMFLNTKVFGIPIPFHTNFPEVNLRFYVRRRSNNEWRRGVVFVNEFVPKPAISFVANHLYHEKYVTYPMRHVWDTGEKLRVSYAWKKNNKWNRIEAMAAPNAHEMIKESKEEFIIEHFWGYSAVDKNKTGEYHVEHPRWLVYPVEQYSIECNFLECYGSDFNLLDQIKPASVFLAEGSKISIFPKSTLKT